MCISPLKKKSKNEKQSSPYSSSPFDPSPLLIHLRSLLQTTCRRTSTSLIILQSTVPPLLLHRHLHLFNRPPQLLHISFHARSSLCNNTTTPSTSLYNPTIFNLLPPKTQPQHPSLRIYHPFHPSHATTRRPSQTTTLHPYLAAPLFSAASSITLNNCCTTSQPHHHHSTSPSQPIFHPTLNPNPPPSSAAERLRLHHYHRCVSLNYRIISYRRSATTINETLIPQTDFSRPDFSPN